MSQKIQFLDFTLDTQQQSLFKGDKRIEITSTAYQLLTCFLDQPNKTVTRSFLTEHVWPNRVVTETSLDKLIQRLRNILGDTEQHKKVIRTIHGVGFVFLPEVREKTKPVNTKSKAHWLFKSLPLAIILLLTLVYALHQSNRSKNNPTFNTGTNLNPKVVALIPDITSLADQDQVWMLRGGLYYLKEHFNQSTHLEIKNISLKKLGTNNPERFAIELSNKNTVDASVIVEISEIDDRFLAAVIIRNADGILAENTLSSPSIKTLYDEIGSWAKGVLAIQTFSPASNTNSTMSQDSYAVENYIRGMSAQSTGYSSEAIKYFELAIKEDPEFWLAWYELSLAYRKQGDYKKALSIISIFENVPLTDKNDLMILNAKALNLYYLGEYAYGIEVLNTGIETAKNSQNNKELTTFLTNKALFAKAMGDLNTALLSTEESITITQTLTGNHDGKLGSSYNTLAGIEINMNHLESAQSHAELAVDFFIKSGDKRYEAKAKSRLSSIYYLLGDWYQGESLIKEVLSIQQSLDDTLGQTTSYMRLCDYDILKGDFAAAEDHLKKLSELMGSVNSKYQNDSFLITKIKVKLHSGDYELAENLLIELQQNITDDSRLLTHYLLSLRLHELKNDDLGWLEIADKFTASQNFGIQPYSQLIMAKAAIKRNINEMAKDAFEQAKQIALQQKSTHAIADVMNPYILFLLSTDKESAYLNLLDLEKHAVPVYPFLKTKSQVLQSKGEYFKASALLEELKTKAGDHWTVGDQLLLEEYRQLIIENDI